MGIRASLAAGACLALLSCAAHSAEKALDRSFSVAPGGTLRVNADSSDITVTGSESDRVVVQIRVKGSERSLEDFDLSAEQTADGVEVIARHKAGGWMSWMGGGIDANVTVQVPQRYSVDLKTSGGDLALSGIEGRAVGKTSGGDISARRIKGPLDVGTSGGDVEVEAIEGKTELRTSGGDVVVVSLQGDLDAKTSGGDIRLTKIEGATSARTSSGDVTVTGVRGNADLQSSGGTIHATALDGGIRAHTSGGDINIELVGANRGIAASSSGGSIELRLPKETAGQVDASTSGGKVMTELPVTTTETGRGKLRGEINGGGQAIHVRTSGGDIRLRAKGAS